MSVSNEHFLIVLERLKDTNKEKIQEWSKGGFQSCFRTLARRDVIIDSGSDETSAHPSEASSPLT